jgi:hypothetical protein
MKNAPKLLLLSWLFSGLAGMVHAEVVVGNIGNRNDYHTEMSYSAKYAQKFTTGNLNLGDADLNGLVYHKFSWALQPGTDGFDPDLGIFPWQNTTFEWSLLSDVEGSPGTAVYPVFLGGYLSISEPGVASAGYSGGYSGSFVLQSNSSYWLSIRFLDGNSHTGLGWFPTLPVTSDLSVYGAGSLGGLMVNTGTGWEEVSVGVNTGTVWNGLFWEDVFEEVSVRALIEIEAESVPEPTSLQLLGFSLGSLWILRGRRRKV